MKIRLLMMAALGFPLVAHADKMRAPIDAPPAFQAECASCHVAFPPGLLAADDWKRVMAALDKHYGDNASLDAKTGKLIEDFLVRNAGDARKVGAGETATAGFASSMGTAYDKELPRLTTTAWFKRKHHEVARADWTNPKVKSPANCAACHTKAADGSYREREIVMPNGRRWEDD